MMTGYEVKRMREKTGQNQTQFWSRVKVQQSTASRYESGRNIPADMQLLLTLAYGTDKQAAAAFAALRKPI